MPRKARNRKHFFYGGIKGITEHLVEMLMEKMPGPLVAGTYCPPFRPLTWEEEMDVKTRIEESRVDVLRVGLGAPKQEKWMAEHNIEKINVPLMLGVGPYFDAAEVYVLPGTNGLGINEVMAHSLPIISEYPGMRMAAQTIWSSSRRMAFG